MMKPDVNFRHWLVCAVVTGWKMQDGDYSRPPFVGAAETPQSLDSLSFGQLIELSRLKGDKNIFYEICRILLGLGSDEVNKARAVDVVCFVGWVTGEVNKINERFKKLSSRPSPTEQRAGIDKLNFGLFGMVDRYARRMHIQNHDEVMAVPWIRVYQCLKMDSEIDKFQRRYMEETQNEYRRQNQRNRKR